MKTNLFHFMLCFSFLFLFSCDNEDVDRCDMCEEKVCTCDHAAVACEYCGSTKCCDNIGTESCCCFNGM